MPISGANLDSWIDEISQLSSDFTRSFEGKFGYPPGENYVRRVKPGLERRSVQLLSSTGIVGDLLDFYSLVEEVSLPDVGSGFFIHSADSLVDGIRGGQPTKVAGFIEDSIIVFGSDGGGALFALNSLGMVVYRLDGGSLVGSVYEVDESGVNILARDLWNFLEYLRGELRRSYSS
ncbi:hypothetical protein [Frankia sp. Cr1]|uniref:hypothetical protein n=1 Tax=Frankia sp. Cr1 TaxID=3073931 RepID=UPI002AD5981E|nr:hypothetical protein [Frankia sp. Cr1]